MSPTSVGTYYFVYAKGPRDARRVKRVVLGHRDSIDPSEAIDKATKKRAEILDGDPHADAKARRAVQKRAVYTFGQLADDWLEQHARPNKKAKSVYNDEKMLDKDVRPAIGSMPVDEIAKTDINRMVDGVAKRAGYSANRTLVLVRTIFRWGVSKDFAKTDPTMGIRRPRKEQARDRDLPWAEVRTFWNSLDGAFSTEIALAIRIALVTGQRIGEEVTQSAKTEFELSGQSPMWTIPGGRYGRTKNDEPHLVPLSPLAVRVIKKAMELAGDSAYLFPSPDSDPEDDKPIGPGVSSRAMSRARGHDERTKPLKPKKRKGKRKYVFKTPRPPKPGLGVKNVRIHDLRRTVASRMAEIGIDESIVSRVLNHISAYKGTVTGRVYNK